MATLEQNLVAKLTGHAGLSALVGTDVHWDFAPSGAEMPYLILTRTGGEATYHQGGESTLAEAHCQFTAWAETRAAAAAVQAALRDCLSGFRGSLGSGGGATTCLGCLRQADETDVPAIAEDGSQLPLFGIAANYQIFYRRAAPAG